MSDLTPHERFAYMLEGLVHHRCEKLDKINPEIIQRLVNELQVDLYKVFQKTQVQLGEAAVDALAVELVRTIKVNEKSLEQLGFAFPDIIPQVTTHDLRILTELSTELEFGDKFRKVLSAR